MDGRPRTNPVAGTRRLRPLQEARRLRPVTEARRRSFPSSCRPTGCLVVAALLVAGLTACGGSQGSAPGGQSQSPTGEQEEAGPTSPDAPTDLVVRSEAFGDGETIPTRYTCDGDGVSPPLSWTKVPAGASELVLVVTDPDAPEGEFVHWVVTGLDPGAGGIDQGSLPDGAVRGTNGFGDVGYGPPCPPAEDTAHRYVFTLYATDQPLDVARGLTADEVRDALEGSALARGRLVGTYTR